MKVILVMWISLHIGEWWYSSLAVCTYSIYMTDLIREVKKLVWCSTNMYDIPEGTSPLQGVNPSWYVQINSIAFLADNTEYMAVGIWYCINSFSNINIQLIRYH